MLRTLQNGGGGMSLQGPTMDELRKAWNHLYAQHLCERTDMAPQDAIEAANVANDAFEKQKSPLEAADEEIKRRS